MARTQKDVVSYFPHDANACAGDTLMVLQSRFGNDGYAFWFKLLEKLASSDGHFIDCRNSTKWQLLLAKTGVNEITGVEIMKLLVEMQAVDKELWESKLIWCQKLVDNIADVYKNRRREIPQKPLITDSKQITTENNTLTTDESTQSKVKETKLNKTKLNKKEKPLKQKFGEFLNVFLTSEEHEKLVKKFGADDTNDRVERLGTYLKSIGKPQKYEDHYATILNWARREGDSRQKKGEDEDDPDKYIKGKYGHMVHR